MDKEEKEEFIKSFAPMRGKGGDLPEGPTPTSRPVAKEVSGAMNGIVSVTECPICGCKEILEIQQEGIDSRLKGGNGVSFYLGCPACPWASEMLSVSLCGSEVD